MLRTSITCTLIAVLAGCLDTASDDVETDTSWSGGKADGAGSTGPLRVTEVNPNPSHRQDAFVEVINTSDAPVDLTTCTLSIGTKKLALNAVAGRPQLVQPQQLAVIVDPSLDATMTPISHEAAMVVAAQPLATLLAGSRKLVIRIAGTESDKADASKPSPAKDVSVERTADDGFALSTVGTTPGERNAINAKLIDVYFANPPGDTVDPIAPHLQAVIDGAKHTLDAAFFQVNNPALIDAFIRAEQRGVKIRFVTDTDYFANPNYAAGYQRMVTAGIPVIDDKRSALMHSKFMVVDGAAVWTGSYNLIVPDHHLFDHADNALYLRSRALATYHTEQFEQLFAGTFGPKKVDAGHHDVFIDGVHVEFYFAPTDHLLDHVTAGVAAAHTSVHFATFSFYQRDLATAMMTAHAGSIDSPACSTSRRPVPARSSRC